MIALKTNIKKTVSNLRRFFYLLGIHLSLYDKTFIDLAIEL